jgi:hypothetical protein
MPVILAREYASPNLSRFLLRRSAIGSACTAVQCCAGCVAAKGRRQVLDESPATCPLVSRSVSIRSASSTSRASRLASRA